MRAPGYTPRRIERSGLAGAESVQEIALTASNGLRLQLAGPQGPLPPGAAANLELRMVSEQGLLSSDPELDRAFAPRRGTVLTSVLSQTGLIAARLRPDAVLRNLHPTRRLSRDGATTRKLRRRPGDDVSLFLHTRAQGHCCER